MLGSIAGGWALSGFLVIQSGPPLSIESFRGSLNRGARSANNTVDTTLTAPELREITGLYKQGNGVFFINPKHINPINGTGVAPDIDAPFPGQVFFNPQAGSLGSLQRRILDGPSFWNYDFGLIKSTPINEKHRIESHVDFFNLFNHPNFRGADQNVNSPTFGRMTELLVSGNSIGTHLIQFGLFYKF